MDRVVVALILDLLKSTTSFLWCWAADHPKVLFAILLPDASTAVWRASGGKKKKKKKRRYWGVNIALCNSFRFLCLISFDFQSSDFCILQIWSTEVHFRRQTTSLSPQFWNVLLWLWLQLLCSQILWFILRFTDVFGGWPVHYTHINLHLDYICLCVCVCFTQSTGGRRWI